MFHEASAWINGFAPLIIAVLTAIMLLRVLKWRLGRPRTAVEASFPARLWSWGSFKILKPFGGGRRKWAFCFHLGLVALVIKHVVFLAGYPWPWLMWKAVALLEPVLYLWLMMLMVMMLRRLWPDPPQMPSWPFSNWLVVILLALTAAAGFFLAHSQTVRPGFLTWAESPWERRALFQNRPAGWLSLHLTLVAILIPAWMAAPLSRHPWHK